jgi:hypothetical protein
MLLANPAPKRTFSHYTTWEEYKNGMWRRVRGSERGAFLAKAIEFTGDAGLYGEWMLRVTREWPVSCSQNLGFTGQNRQAWIGHAACCLATQCPEDITREAWWYLTKQQQDDANAAADRAIFDWETRERDAGQQVLFEGLCRNESSV